MPSVVCKPADYFRYTSLGDGRIRAIFEIDVSALSPEDLLTTPRLEECGKSFCRPYGTRFQILPRACALG